MTPETSEPSENVAGTAPVKNKGGRPKLDQPEIPEPEEEQGDGADPILKDMRWAYRNAGVHCRGRPNQTAFRDLLRKDRLKFLAELRRLEKEFREERRRASAIESEAVEEERVPVDRLLELGRRWLAADRERAGG